MKVVHDQQLKPGPKVKDVPQGECFVFLRDPKRELWIKLQVALDNAFDEHVQCANLSNGKLEVISVKREVVLVESKVTYTCL
jgi:hypothetical protein